MIRRIAHSAAVAVMISTVFTGAAVARADRQAASVVWHPQTAMSGPVGAGATATLIRRPNGVNFHLVTNQLHAHHAYTVWFVVINNPGACASTPCSGPDILLNPATDSQVTYAAGHVSGGSGRGGFAGSFHAGSIDGWLSGGGLWSPMTAEIQLVINDHGPVLPGYLPGMTHTYRAGCTDASLPAIFPATARADGVPGPNTCQLYQVVAFVGF
ncbi:MAG: hypothetical protein ACR2K4_08575 [Candidatus Limnocylindria bacterium]